MSKKSSLDEIINRLVNNDPSFVKIDLDGIQVNEQNLRRIIEALDKNDSTGNLTWSRLFDPDLDPRVRSLVDELKSKLNKNNEAYQRYPSDFVLAILSCHVYQDDIVNGQSVELRAPSESRNKEAFKMYNRHVADWKIEESFRDMDGFCGTFYVNEKKRHAVLACRGTKFHAQDLLTSDNSLRTNIESVMGHKLVTQQVITFIVVEKCLELVRRKGFYLSFTGFGLGGWSAGLAVFYCQSELKHHDVKAVCFESPGCLLNLDELVSQVHSPQSLFNYDKLNITTYLTEPNFVNCANKHVGRLYLLAVERDPDENSQKPNWIKKLIDKIWEKITNKVFIVRGINALFNHNVNFLLTGFDSNGHPKRSGIIEDWPFVDFNVDFDTNSMMTDFVNDKIIREALKCCPFASMLPNTLTRWAAKGVTALASPVLKTGMVSILKLVYALVKDTVDYSQLKEASNLTLELSTKSDNSYASRLKQIELKYRGHYRVRDNFESNVDVALVMNEGSEDFYLKQLDHNMSEEFVVRSFMEEELMLLKKEFEINIDDGYRMFFIYTFGGKSPNQVREIISRIIDLDPSLADLLLRGRRKLKSPQMADPSWRPVDPRSSKKSDAQETPIEIPNNLPELIGNYIERKSIESNIDSCLKKEKTVVIHGSAGFGKSQMVIRFASKQKNTIIRWFRADTVEKLECDLINFAILLNISTPINQRNTFIDQMNQKLMLVKKPIMFVFDNIEDYSIVSDFVRNLPRNVKVILTARSLATFKEELGASICVDCFTREDVSSYLSENLSELDKKELSFVQKNLSLMDRSIPMTVIKVVTLIKQQLKQNPINNIIDRINKGELKSDKLYENMLSNDGVRRIAIALTCLDPDLVTFKLVEKIFSQVKPEDLLVYINEMEKSFGIQVISTKKVIKIDRTVQKEMREFLSKNCNDEFNVIQDVIYSTLEREIREELKKMGNKFPNSEAFNHSVFLAKTCEEESERRAHLMYQISRYCFLKLVNFDKTYEYSLKALEIRERLNDPKQLAFSQDQVGKILLIRGDFKQSMDFVRESLLNLERVYKQDHTEIANAYFTLGTVFEKMMTPDSLEQAFDSFKIAFEMRKRLYEDQNHADIADSMDSIGQILLLQGEYKNAAEYFQKAYEMRQLLFDGDHPDVANSLSNLSCVYTKLDNLDLELFFASEALRMYQSLYNEDHPSISKSWIDLGVAYGLKGEFKDKLECEKRSESIYKKLYGANDNIAVAKLYQNMGDSNYNLKDHKEAKKYYKLSLEMLERIFPPKGRPHELKAKNLGQLANFYLETNDSKKGLEFAENAYIMCQELFEGSDDNETTIDVVKTLGVAYFNNKNYQEALKKFDQVYNYRVKTLGPNHELTIQMMKNKALVYKKSGQEDDYRNQMNLISKLTISKK